MTHAYQQQQSKIVQLGNKLRFTFCYDEFKIDGETGKQVAVLDRHKFKSGLLPNFLHLGDGAIVNLVLKQFHKEGKDIVTIHDAFYTKNSDKEFVSFAYVSALKKLLKNDPMRQLVHCNDMSWSDVPIHLQDYFDKKHVERRALIRKFDYYNVF